MLALGSLCLLVGAFFFVTGLGPFGTPVIPLLLATTAGFVLHLFGWVALNDAAAWPAMRATFLLSLLGFAVGVATVLSSTRNLGLFLLSGGWLLLPYVPIVFGPVVIAHGFLLLLVYIRLGREPRLLLLGSFALLTVAGLGIVAQVVFLVALSEVGLGAGAFTWLTVFAGLTCVGYGIAAFEFASEYERYQVPLGPFLQPTVADHSR